MNEYNEYGIEELVSLIMRRDGISKNAAFEKAYEIIEADITKSNIS